MTEKQNIADVIVIGGGPAGLSAALWCSELGMKTILFEKEAEFGGQLLHIHNPIKNYLGVETMNGREMRDIFLRSVEKRDFFRRLETDVLEVNTADKSVLLKNSERYSYSALIVATGVRRRKLGVLGEEEFHGKGIIDSGSKYRENATGKTVVIVGGGDAALENALILSEFASRVYVIHRSEEFRARDEFLERAKNHPRIELCTKTIVRKFSGDPVRTGSLGSPPGLRRGGRVSRTGCSDRVSWQTLADDPVRTGSGSDWVFRETLESVELKDLQTGESKILPCDVALVRIGVEPNTEMLRGKVDLDQNGYVLVNAGCETSVAGVFAIGDGANPKAPTISSAVGMGATAAKAALRWTSRMKAV